jgi:hypothetical protein
VRPVRRQPERARQRAERDRRRRAPVALVEPQPTEQRGVDHRTAQPRPARCQRAAEERLLDVRRVRDQHATGHRLQQRVGRLLLRRRALEVELAQPVDADGLRRDRVRRPGEALARAREHDPAVVDGHGAPGDDRVTARVQPGRLEVDDAERGLAPRGAP